MLAWWSYILASSGALNYFLAIRGRVEGLYLGLLNQVFWTGYAFATGAYGFLFTVALFVPINLVGLKEYYKNKSGSTPKPRGREYCD